MSDPVVSVLMPTLNSERTLARSLASIRAQTVARDAVEILVADGGSTDRTRAIAAEYGATVLENERVLPEDGISVALAAARGHHAVTMGSDEVLRNPTVFATKIRLLAENPRVHNIVFAGLANPAGFPAIGTYFNRCGDPFSFFMHGIDGGDQWGSLARHYRIAREAHDYRVFAIAPDQPFPIVDGHFFDLRYLRSIADTADRHVVAHLFVTMAAEDRLLGVVKDDIIDHHSTAHYRTGFAKIEWRIIANMHHGDDGMAGYANREHVQPLGYRLKKYAFLPYSLSVVGPVLDAASLALRLRSPAMLYHAPLTVQTGLAIVKHGAMKAFGLKPPQKAYGR